MNNQQIKEQIIHFSKELRLPTFRRDYKTKAEQSAKDNKSYEAYLLDLMDNEYQTRLENRKKQRIRSASFPYKKYLEDLNRDELPKDAIKKLSVYATGSNLHYFKSVSGDTPEVGGVQYGQFPVPRTITIGLNLTF